MSSEDNETRCSKSIKVSNGFVMSGLFVGITTLSIFGIIIAYFVLVYFGVPIEVIYIFIALVLFAFILISIGVIINKSKCEESESEPEQFEEPNEIPSTESEESE